MRASSVAVWALASGVLVIAGCSGTLSTPAPTDISTAAANAVAQREDVERDLVFVVDSPSSGGVLVYRQNGPHHQNPLRSVNQDLIAPNAVWVDPNGNVWVANGGDASSGLKSTILRFPRRGTQPPDRILKDFGWDPTALWVSRTGAVYVVNAPASARQRSEIVEYPPREKTYTVIGDRKISHGITAVLGDAKGDLFAAGFTDSGNGEIDERPAGSAHWDDTGIAGKGRSVTQPYDLAFDAQGNVVVADYGTRSIETFPPGKAKPSNTIKCIPMDCTVIAFNQSGNRLWVGEPDYSTGSVDEFDYPSGTFVQGLTQPDGLSPVSLATSPGLYP
jgi:hypothetical protein